MPEYSKVPGLTASVFILFLSTFWVIPVYSQDASLLDSYFGSPVAEYDDTVELLGGGSPESEEPLALGALAALIMERWEVAGGLMYTVTGAPRYAIRDLRDKKVFPQTPAFKALRRPLSGSESLRLLSRANEEFGGFPQSAGPLPATPPVAAKAAPVYLALDLEERFSGKVDNEESSLANRFSISLDGWAPNETRLTSELTVESDDEELVSPFLEQLNLTSRLGPYPSGAYGDLSIGRKRLSDVTGRIISLPLDGVQLQWVGEQATMVAGLGATALLREEQGPPGFSRSSVSDLAGEADNLAPSTLLALWRISFPETWGRQTPTVELLGRVDGRSLTELKEEEDSLDIYIASFALGGPLGLRTFYDASVSLQSGLYQTTYPDQEQDSVITLGTLIRASLRWFPRSLSRTRLGLESIFASGDADGEHLLQNQSDSLNTAFFSGTGETPWTMYPGTLSNVVVFRGFVESRLWDPVLLGLSGALLTRATEQPTGIEEAAASDNRPLGSEFGGRILIEPFRDVKLEWISSIFIPLTVENGGAFRDGTDPFWKSEASLTLQL
jgi:hypothetical protein